MLEEQVIQEITPIKYKEPKVSNIDPILNHAISELINKFTDKENEKEKNTSTKGTKSLINHLENTTKSLQRCIYKPENKKELLNDDTLVDLINRDSGNIKSLISLLQKRVSELKNKANADFSPNTENLINLNFASKNPNSKNISNGIQENSKVNYFIFESMCEGDDHILSTANKYNFIYFMIISPHDKTIDFVTFDKEVFLSYQFVNFILEKSSLFEKILNLSFENFIEEQNFNHCINLKKIYEKIDSVANLTLSVNNKMIQFEDFTLNKTLLLQDSYEGIKDLFIKKEYLTNLISTNNMKLMKDLLENEFNFFCAVNQMSQAGFLII